MRISCLFFSRRGPVSLVAGQSALMRHIIIVTRGFKKYLELGSGKNIYHLAPRPRAIPSESNANISWVQLPRTLSLGVNTSDSDLITDHGPVSPCHLPRVPGVLTPPLLPVLRSQLSVHSGPRPTLSCIILSLNSPRFFHQRRCLTETLTIMLRIRYGLSRSIFVTVMQYNPKSKSGIWSQYVNAHSQLTLIEPLHLRPCWFPESYLPSFVYCTP